MAHSPQPYFWLTSNILAQALLLATAGPPIAQAATLNVGPGAPYTTIAAAKTAAAGALGRDRG